MNKNLTQLSHCNIRYDDGKFDPYQLIFNKTQRLSWNQLSDTSLFVNKCLVINWFSQIRRFSDETVRVIVIEGILNGMFQNISFILNLTRNVDFSAMITRDIYRLLFDFVCNTPLFIRNVIDDDDFSLSCNVLSLLSGKR